MKKVALFLAAVLLISTLPVMAQDARRPEGPVVPPQVSTEQAVPRQGHPGQGWRHDVQRPGRPDGIEGHGWGTQRPPIPPMMFRGHGPQGSAQIVLPGFYGWYSWSGGPNADRGCVRCHPRPHQSRHGR